MPDFSKTSLILLTALTLSACTRQPQSSIPTLAEGFAVPTHITFRDHWHPSIKMTPAYVTMPYRAPWYAAKEDFVPIDEDFIPIKAKVTEAKFFPLETSKKSLWERIRGKLAFTRFNNSRVEKHVDYLRRDPYHLSTLSKRARPFLYYIVETIESRGMPLELALVPMIESGFEPDAVSHAQAAGLWQIMPTTGKYLGLTLNDWYDGRFDISDSTKAALDYLEYLHDFFDGDWLLALAAYNAGEGTVQRAIRANKQAGKKADYWNLQLPRETQIYVPKILALSRIIANPDAYGLDLQPIADEPYLETVEIGPQINLSVAAALAGMSRSELEHYNPGFTRGVTPPEKPHDLLLPRDKALALQRKLAQMDKSKGRQRYTVKRGDTLSFIAQRYNVSYRDLARWNGLTPNSILRPGQKLVIRSPIAAEPEKILAIN